MALSLLLADRHSPEETQMDKSGYVLWTIALVIFGLVLIFAMWHRINIDKAKTAHRHTGTTELHPDLRNTDGCDAGTMLY
jgi:hypothetical protein